MGRNGGKYVEVVQLANTFNLGLTGYFDSSWVETISDPLERTKVAFDEFKCSYLKCRAAGPSLPFGYYIARPRSKAAMASVQVQQKSE
jgi:hypothetical protein